MVADLTASRIAHTRLRVLEATTADAHLTADYVRGTVQITRWDGGRAVIEHAPVSADEPLERELLAFLHAVRRGGPPEVDLDAAVRCMQVVDAIRRHTAVAGAGRRGLGGVGVGWTPCRIPRPRSCSSSEAARERAERARPRGRRAAAEERAHERRAEKHAYLREKLAEREKSDEDG